MIILIIAVLPFGIIYFLSDLLALIFHKVIRYRKKVILTNLRFAFPQKSNEEISKLLPAIYKNISDVIFESLAAYGKSNDAILNRMEVINKDIFDDLYDRCQNAVVYSGHFGNWEWGSIVNQLRLKNQLNIMYKPLSNIYINKYLKRRRERSSIKLLSIYKPHRILLKEGNESNLFVYVADQYNHNKNNNITVPFFGHPTGFLSGAEKLAMKKKYPVIFCYFKRISRGKYHALTNTLEVNTGQLQPGDITKKYAEYLEQLIRENPTQWLWSHKRWKAHLNY